MTHRRKKLLLASLVAVPVIFALAMSGETPVAKAQVGERHLEWVGGPEKTTAPIPPDCSTWHEIYPNYCAPSHQDGYEDNGDGEVSPCDYIYLDGECWHIVWVGPTYWISCETFQSALEPTDPGTPGNPTCQVWHEVYPNFCQPRHIENWEDNGDGVVGVCDYIWIGGLRCHIDDVRLNITIVPCDGTATEEGSWGKVKGLFRNIF